MDISHKQKYIVCTNMIFIFRLSFPRTSGSITFQFLPLVLGKVAHILSNHLIITKHLSQLLQIRLQSKLNLHAYLFLFPTINANINFEEIVSFRLKLYQWFWLKLLKQWYFVSKIVLVIEKNRSSRPRICNLQVTRTIYSISERSEQFLTTECFFNLFLEVSHI